tara:strand:- start:313 stop:1572 length:1260 start_codon:yes stop_codon:yes gene_type:complete
MALKHVELANISYAGKDQIPVTNYVNENDYEALMKFLKQPEFSGHVGENIRILTVGIPADLINTLSNPPYTMGSRDTKSTEGIEHDKIIEVHVHKRDLEHPEIIFKPQKFLFDSSLFLLDGGISDIPDRMYFKQLSRLRGTTGDFIKYRRATSKGLSRSIRTRDVFRNAEYDFLTSRNKHSIVKNHLDDYMLKAYYKLLLGLTFDEQTFLTEDELNDLLIDPSYGKAAIMLMQGHDDVGPHITAGKLPASWLMRNAKVYQNKLSRIASIDDLSSVLVPEISVPAKGRRDNKPEVQPGYITEEEVHVFRSLCSSHLLTYPADKLKVLSPQTFDRVFMIAVDPDHFEIDVKETVRYRDGAEAWKSRIHRDMLIKGKKLKKMTKDSDINPEGYYMKPRPRKVGHMTLQDMFISINSVTVEED